MSAMRETMDGQPAALRALLSDAAPVEAAASALSGRRGSHTPGRSAKILRLQGSG